MVYRNFMYRSQYNKVRMQYDKKGNPKVMFLFFRYPVLSLSKHFFYCKTQAKGR